MEKEIDANRVEEALSEYEVIDGPIVVKVPNKQDMVMITLEEYLRMRTIESLRQSEEDIKQGKVHLAKDVFKELRKKYGY